MKIAKNICELIGNTPMLRLNKIVNEKGVTIFVKLEYFNPGGSIKDRVAYEMIIDAEKKGFLKPGYKIVEPTSGNTGIGLAMVGAARGYEVILVMPETMSIERRRLLKAFGGQIILTPGEKGMEGAINKAKELVSQNSDYYMTGQFDNPANPLAHEKSTALEILNQTDGKIDAFVAGVGTGGTLTGIGKVLKKRVQNIKIVAVEPENSAVISGEKPGAHGLQGIGAGFIPKVLDTSIITDIVKVSDEKAFETTRDLALREGILVGISSGAAIYGALEIAKNMDKGNTIVVIAPDTGERYLSTGIFK